MPENFKLVDLSYTQNRELSWLKFNQRVLNEANDCNVPLIERLRFISIFTSNLNEFFMVRVGSIYDLSLIDPKGIENKSGLTAEEQLDNIFNLVSELYVEKDNIYKNIMGLLCNNGVKDIAFCELTFNEKEYVYNYWKDNIKPIISFQIIDQSHPFPYIKGNTLYILATLHDKKSSVGIVEIPSSLSPVLILPGDTYRYIRIESIILSLLVKIFQGYIIDEKSVFSITRNADITFDEDKFDDDTTDMLTHMEKVVKKRKKLCPVRLEINGNNPKLIKLLIKYLKIKEHQVFICKSPLKMEYAYLLKPKCKSLYYVPYNPKYPTYLLPQQSMWSQILQRDILLFFPYQSMQPFFDLLSEASTDPNIISIKITIYRLAKHSTIAKLLCEAAENGKEVTVLMELRARFDETNNIEWAKELEQSGCKVVYGIEGFKCHSKICLITKKVGSEITYITQIGTGNYNEKTSALYTDFSLMTSNMDIASDAIEFFQNMMIGNLNGEYHNLLVAPNSMKSKIIELIDDEIAKGSSGRIVIKANSVTDRKLIEKLSEASSAGVKIDLIIRGICCIIPGISTKTDNINVNSIVGRFLEHSRIYCFGTGQNKKIYISSADIMTRNQNRRVEIACPIFSLEIKNFLEDYLEKILKDNVKRRTLTVSGEYIVPKTTCKNKFNVQEFYIKQPICLQNTLDNKKDNKLLKFIRKLYR